MLEVDTRIKAYKFVAYSAVTFSVVRAFTCDLLAECTYVCR